MLRLVLLTILSCALAAAQDARGRNRAAPNTNPTNSLFGKVSSTVGFPRYIHFGLKLTY